MSPDPNPPAADRTDGEPELPARRAARGDLEAAILDEARRLLVSQGYTDLSMRKIATAIGVTPTSIYLYFKSKDALLHALIDEGMGRLHAELTRAAESSSDPRARIEALCRGYLRFGLESSEFYEVMFMLHPQHMERYPAENYRRARKNLELFTDVLRELSGEAGIGEAELLLEVNVLWSTLHGAVALWIAKRLDARLDEHEFLDATVRRVTTNLLHHADPRADRAAPESGFSGVAEAS